MSGARARRRDRVVVPPKEETWAAPPHTVERVDGGRLRLVWWPTRSQKRVATFRLLTDDGAATLSRVTEIIIRRRKPSYASVDDDPSRRDLPEWTYRVVTRRGYDLVEVAP